tara:strand:+ start:1806 stop:2042 length:237 start_codon:yes stop_codon:yes gene_type:complete
MILDENVTERQKAFFALQKVTELMNVCTSFNSPTVSKNLSDLRIELTQILTRLTIEEKNSIITEIDTTVPEINLGEIL